LHKNAPWINHCQKHAQLFTVEFETSFPMHFNNSALVGKVDLLKCSSNCVIALD